MRRVSTLTAITPLDEDLKTQFQDELVFGADYQFRGYWSAGARYVHRALKRIIEDIGTFTNPDDPLELTGYVIGNPGEGFFGAPFEKPERNYDALELSLPRAAEQRLADVFLDRVRAGARQSRGVVHERLRPARPEHQRAL